MPRRRGRSSAAHRLAASRSQRCLTGVKVSLPGCPKTARSHASLRTSVSGSRNARRGMPGQAADQPVLRAAAGELVQPVSPGPPQLPGNLAQLGRAGDGTARGALLQSVEQLATAPSATPWRLTCPGPSTLAGSAARHAASSKDGSARSLRARVVSGHGSTAASPAPARTPHLAQIPGCKRSGPGL